MTGELLAPLPPAMSGLLSARTGIVRRLTPLVSDLLPRAMVGVTAEAAATACVRGAQTEPFGASGFGAALSAAEAQHAAVGEAVERYGSLVGGRCVPLVWGTYRELSAHAVHGAELVLPSEAELCPPFARFADDQPRGWVVGRDVAADRDVLIPAQLVVPDYRPRYDAEWLAPWTTSGLAAHTDRSRAITAGLREIIERDAFVVRFLNRLTPPELSIRGRSPELDQLLDSMPHSPTLRLRAWDITLDLGQPVALALLSCVDPNYPPLCFGAACHADLRSAVLKAAFESFGTLVMMAAHGFPATATGQPLPMSATIDDQFAQTCQPGYLQTLDWLLDPTVDPGPAASTDTPGTELQDVIDPVVRRGHRVIVVDLTPPDLAELGWHVCHVCVTGCQPLTFGTIRRLANPRLYDLPVELGFRTRPAREDELNPMSHPFT